MPISCVACDLVLESYVVYIFVAKNMSHLRDTLCQFLALFISLLLIHSIFTVLSISIGLGLSKGSMKNPVQHKWVIFLKLSLYGQKFLVSSEQKSLFS